MVLPTTQIFGVKKVTKIPKTKTLLARAKRCSLRSRSLSERIARHVNVEITV